VARASEAHTAPIYVTIRGAPDLALHPRAKALARAWNAHLEELEARLSDEQIAHLAADSGWPIPVAEMKKAGPILLDAIETAKRSFAGRAR